MIRPRRDSTSGPKSLCCGPMIAGYRIGKDVADARSGGAKQVTGDQMVLRRLWVIHLHGPGIWQLRGE